MSSTIRYVHLIDEGGSVLGSQYPLATNGDSVYSKDIWEDQSELNTFTGGAVASLFSGLHTVLTDSTANDPKELFIHFNRTTPTTVIGIGAFTGNFSNVKISALVSGPVEVTLVDESASDIKYTTRQFDLPTIGFNALRIQFHTTDPVSVSNMYIAKSRSMVARIQGQKPDDTFGEFQITQGGSQKASIEEFDASVSVNNNTQLKATLFSAAGDEVLTDIFGKDLVVIAHEHNKIHAGDHYFVGSHITLANAGVFDIIITTPNTDTRMHYTAHVNSTAEMVVDVREAVTESGDGTPFTAMNSNRNSSNTAEVTIKVDPVTVSGLGTLLRAHSGGSTGPFAVGTSARSTSENIFLPDTKYLIRVTSGANDNIIDWEVVWYEV